MKVETLFLCLLAALGLSSLVIALTTFSPAGRRFPLIVSLILLALVIVQLISSLRGKTSDENLLSRESLQKFIRNHWLVVFWTVGGLGMVYLCGFVAGTFLLVFGYILHQRETWKAALAYAVGTGLLTYLGFQVALQVRFYPGLIMELLGF